MISTAISRRSQLALNRPPPRRRDPYHHLDRLATSLHHLALRRCKPGANEADQHRPLEGMTIDEQLLVEAVAAAGEQLQRPAALGGETAATKRQWHPASLSRPPRLLTATDRPPLCH